jgi:hypothetical protein
VVTNTTAISHSNMTFAENYQRLINTCDDESIVFCIKVKVYSIRPATLAPMENLLLERMEMKIDQESMSALFRFFGGGVLSSGWLRLRWTSRASGRPKVDVHPGCWQRMCLPSSDAAQAE